jgi:DNA repair protein RecO (recombination protein O)
MLHTRGIVLHQLKYGETSLILDVLTREAGIKHCIINGVRKTKAGTGAAVVEPGQIADWVLYENSSAASGALVRVKEVRPGYYYKRVSIDFPRKSVVFFIIELVRACVKEPERNEGFYDWVESGLIALDQAAPPVSLHHLHFAIKLMGWLGFEPMGHFSEETPFLDLREGVFCASLPAELGLTDPDTVALWSLLQRADYKDLPEIKAQKADRKLLLERVLSYYAMHLDYFKGLQSPAILQQVFG